MKKIFFLCFISIFIFIAVACEGKEKSLIDDSQKNDAETTDYDDSDTGNTGDDGNTGNTGDSGEDVDEPHEKDVYEDSDVDSYEESDADSDDFHDESQDEIPDYDEQNDGEVISCFEHSECGDEDSFCKKDEGDCEGEGVCSLKETVCNPVYSPVCGCDDKTYGNECEAHSFGVNVNFDGECPSTVFYEYRDSGMPPIVLEGEAIINEGVSQHIFDDPTEAKFTKSTFSAVFVSGKDQLVFKFWRSDFENLKCSEETPCEVLLEKGDSSAVWHRDDGLGGEIPMGELSGKVIITDFEEGNLKRVLEFHADELTFIPFG
ncbi:MAG: hypothetical protein R6W70_03725 [bacterium]